MRVRHRNDRRELRWNIGLLLLIAGLSWQLAPIRGRADDSAPTTGAQEDAKSESKTKDADGKDSDEKSAEVAPTCDVEPPVEVEPPADATAPATEEDEAEPRRPSVMLENEQIGEEDGITTTAVTTTVRAVVGGVNVVEITVNGAAAVAEAPELDAEAAAAEPAAPVAVQAQVIVGGIAVAGPGGQNVEDAMTQQYVQQFRPILAGELAFVRQICNPSPALRGQIKAAGEAGLLEIAKKHAAGQGQMRGIRIRRLQNGVQQAADGTPPRPRPFIHEAITKVLTDSLPAETLDRYKQEFEYRTEQRKQAAILTVVAALDRSLLLSAEQREGIQKSIRENWQEEWMSWLMLPNYGGMYVPQIPDNVLSAKLDADQRTVWNSLQKIGIGDWEGNDGEMNNWWDEEADQAAANLGEAAAGEAAATDDAGSVEKDAAASGNAE